MSFRKILIAVDESAFAARAVDVGFDLARSLGAEVAIIHVVDPFVVAYAPEGGIPASELVTLAQQDGRRLLGSFGERAALQPVPLEFIHVGKPAVEIVKAARDWPADLIVIGSHGRGGVGRLLLGSVAEAVMRHAACPVLVVRAEKWARSINRRDGVTVPHRRRPPLRRYLLSVPRPRLVFPPPLRRHG